MDLDELRARLSAVDRELIERVAERQHIVDEIGRRKMSTGRATRDFRREKDVIDMGRRQAEELGVDPALAESLLTLLIRSSLTHQEQARVSAEGRGDGRRVLVIGGSGKMGGWFVGFFASQGFDVTIADPTPTDQPVEYHADWRDAGTDYDIIVVAAPLARSAEILTDLAERRPGGLVFDVGSLKSPLREPLQALAARGCRVTSLHPMFGPDTRLLSGRHVIFCDVGVPEATQEARGLFAATMAERIDMDLEDHDRLIAYVLGLSHALNIAFFTALAESGEAAPRLSRMSSTTFDAQLDVSARVAGDNPGLYFEIQRLNEFGLEPLDALCESAERIRELVRSGDERGFVELMQRGREYLASRAPVEEGAHEPAGR
ncbi:MAG: prephenate dehydrogenase/arogenate dehydrogenase family protein [Gammaproteobacteria bacterium]